MKYALLILLLQPLSLFAQQYPVYSSSWYSEDNSVNLYAIESEQQALVGKLGDVARAIKKIPLQQIDSEELISRFEEMKGWYSKYISKLSMYNSNQYSPAVQQLAAELSEETETYFHQLLTDKLIQERINYAKKKIRERHLPVPRKVRVIWQFMP